MWKRIKGGLTYDKRTRSIKRFKKVTLEELDEAIKAVDKQEQEEAIEYFKKHIK